VQVVPGTRISTPTLIQTTRVDQWISASSGVPGVTEAEPDVLGPDVVDPAVIRREAGEVEGSIDSPYNVFLWNDPVTLMEIVVRVLKKVFGYDTAKAEQLMMVAHNEGKVVVWAGERDRAVRYCLELGTNGLQSTVARAA
jgi:ATP-dependent Clp protease adaptor protein ClpS